jgi:hypothetical protein
MRCPSLKGEDPRIGDDRMIGKETRNSTWDLGRDIYYQTIAIGYVLVLVTYWIYSLTNLTFSVINGYSVLLMDTPLYRMPRWVASVLTGGCSMGITETPVGTGCSWVLMLLVRYNSSDTPLR